VREGYGKIAKTAVPAAARPKLLRLGAGRFWRPHPEHRLFPRGNFAALPPGPTSASPAATPNALARLSPVRSCWISAPGAGLDVYIAGNKVGATGRAIGVDMTPEMLAPGPPNLASLPRAHRSGQHRVSSGRDRAPAGRRRQCRCDHFELRPQSLARQTAVLARNRPRAAAGRPRRGFRPGPPPAASRRAIASMVEALVGCVAGAALVSDTEKMARDAGLTDLKLTPEPAYLEHMVNRRIAFIKRSSPTCPPGRNRPTMSRAWKSRPQTRRGLTTDAPALRGSPRRPLPLRSPMCCSTRGVRPGGRSALVRFAADLNSCRIGASSPALGLAQNPRRLRERPGAQTPSPRRAKRRCRSCWSAVSWRKRRYPTREELAASLGLAAPTPTLFTPAGGGAGRHRSLPSRPTVSRAALSCA